MSMHRVASSRPATVRPRATNCCRQPLAGKQHAACGHHRGQGCRDDAGVGSGRAFMAPGISTVKPTRPCGPCRAVRPWGPGLGLPQQSSRARKCGWGLPRRSRCQRHVGAGESYGGDEREGGEDAGRHGPTLALRDGTGSRDRGPRLEPCHGFVKSSWQAAPHPRHVGERPPPCSTALPPCGRAAVSSSRGNAVMVQLSPPSLDVAVLVVGLVLYAFIWFATRNLSRVGKILARLAPLGLVIPAMVYLSWLSGARL